MGTDKNGLSEEVQNLNSNWTPSYLPFFRTLVEAGLKLKKHTAVFGTVKSKETNILGDARANIIDMQDTEVKHAKSGIGEKVFSKYLLGIKYVQSVFQDNSDMQRCADQILEENLKQFDEHSFNGAPTKSGALRNNGFWASTDPNYVTNTAASLAKNASLDEIKAVFDALLKQGETAVGNAPKIFAMTRDIANFMGKFVPNQAICFAQALRDAYAAEGVQVSFGTIPSNLTSGKGILLITPSLVTFDYIDLPFISGTGDNPEDDYQYIKEQHGSSRVDVEKQGAIIKQPINITTGA